HRFTLETEQGEECAGPAEGTPQVPAEYGTAWQEWERAAPAGESLDRAEMVQEMRACLNNGNAVLNVGELGLTTLPDCLPAHITTLIIPRNNLARLPALPPGLRELIVSNNPLTSLTALPPGLRDLTVINSHLLTSLPELPSGLQTLSAYGNQLTR
ncbi:E3 ubiquitin--protein ligase, partial [Salmonella enterica subsp. houtenae]|nr:E3 ubiquitin--protein ligase [Salmonella enterica subsp. houtenae]